jgi:hypothetical protein
MSTAFQRTLRFVVAQAEHQPIQKQVQIFEDLAIVCGDQTEADHFRSIATSLKDIESDLAKVQLTLFSNNNPQR